MKKNNSKKIFVSVVMYVLLLIFANCTTAYAAGTALNLKSVTLETGQSKQLKMTGTKKKKITWKSSNKKIAVVSKNGKVTAKKAGTAKITAKVGKKKYTCMVRVKSRPEPKLSASNVTLSEGDLYQFSMKNARGKASWSSSNKNVFTINSQGRVTAKKAGKAKMTVKMNGKKYTATVTVKKATTAAAEPILKPDYSHENLDINCQAPLAHPAVKRIFTKFCFHMEIKTDTDYSGYFSAKGQAIIMKKPGNVIYHELGHFLAWIAGNADYTAEWKEIYDEEKSFVTSPNKAYVIHTPYEYFAESYKDYVLTNQTLKATRPKTYAYITQKLNRIDDKPEKYWDNLYSAYYKVYWKDNK